jgi:mRNA interferase MazF
MEGLKQYQIVIVNLDPTVGSEIKKTRPCVILSPDEMNTPLNTVIIAPVTSRSKPYPTRVEIEVRKHQSWVVLDQIRTIDKKRIVKKGDSLKKREIGRIKEVLKETLID